LTSDNSTFDLHFKLNHQSPSQLEFLILTHCLISFTMSFLSRDLTNLQTAINSMVGAMRQSLVQPTTTDSLLEDFMLTPVAPLLMSGEPLLSTAEAIAEPEALISTMNLDVHSTPTHYLISCDLPGVDKNCIDIKADHRTRILTIVAERKSEFTEMEPSQATPSSVGVGQQQAQAKTSTSTQPQPASTSPTTVQEAPSAQPMSDVGGGSEQKEQQGQVSIVKMKTDKEKQVGAARPRVIRQERFFGSIKRSIRLARDADLDHIEAKYENGVLHLQVPRKQEPEDEQRYKKIQLQ